MKIFYAVQATGNGHISRANQLVPILQNYGMVDVFLSGHNYSLTPNFDVTYKSKGLSLFYTQCGGVDLVKTIFGNNLKEAMYDAKSLPVEAYDLVINDFDWLTARACKLKNVKSIQFGHQASFTSPLAPRPLRKEIVGEYVLQNFAKAQKYVGLHFKAYDEHIHPPIIKTQILDAEPRNMGHVSVYLPSVSEHCILNALQKIPDVTFHWFLHGLSAPTQFKNIMMFPVTDEGFTSSLISCHGLITGGGFETPAEALYLGKKLLSIPINKHYEQQCNAAALSKLGVKVILKPDYDNFEDDIIRWLAKSEDMITIEACQTESLVAHIVQSNKA
jgi:uncharacterized protein (TIGR00661 family)